ncbi:hypothetical protein BY996DRAFT_6680131 [Phakopsora pachyrhizi]|nr:hypothetical protein BY996DRAFT_6680131 [Phakopsora pachyrhizi]
MPVSEYARSQYEEDSDFVLSEEEVGSASEQPNDDSIRPGVIKPVLEDSQPDGLNNQESISPTDENEKSIPLNALSASNSKFINHVDLVMEKVKALEADKDWSKVLKHRNGVEVFVQKHAKLVGKNKGVPIFKGVGLIKGYSTASVFGVIGSSKLWDEWYEDGNLVENLSDQVSLTYMCMKAAIGTRTRDLSLVEKVEALQDGSIYFCASSVNTPRVPAVPGRVRANIALNAWVLEPTALPQGGVMGESGSVATKITYYLQVDVKTFVPEAISKRYLARRPLCITKIDTYLQKNGSPLQIEGINDSETRPRQGGARRSFSRGYLSIRQLDALKENLNQEGSSVANSSSTNLSQSLRSKRYLSTFGLSGSKSTSSKRRLSSSPSAPALHLPQPLRDKRRQSTGSKRGMSQTDASDYASGPESTCRSPLEDHSAPVHLAINETTTRWPALKDTLENFETCLKDSITNQKDWQVSINSTNLTKIWIKSKMNQKSEKDNPKGRLFQLPVVKSEAIISAVDEAGSPAVTKTQVLVTILSGLAQQVWDESLSGSSKLGVNSSGPQTLLLSDNGFDQSTYFSTMKSIYPHIRDEPTFLFDQAVVRKPHDQTEDSVQSKFMIIQHSVDDEAQLLESFQKFQDSKLPSAAMDLSSLKEIVESNYSSRISMAGWLIQTGASSDEIQVIHISSLWINLEDRNKRSRAGEIPPFLKNLIAFNIANRPHQLSEFIRLYGFCPGFVRWTAGDVEYLGEFEHTESSVEGYDRLAITMGEVEWRFNQKNQSKEGTYMNSNLKNSSPTTQICWFQWSDKMYPNGIDLKLEPAGVAQLRIVEGMQNTLQFNWINNNSQKTGSNFPMKITLKAKAIRDQKMGVKSEVFLNGNKVVDEVQTTSQHKINSYDSNKIRSKNFNGSTKTNGIDIGDKITNGSISNGFKGSDGQSSLDSILKTTQPNPKQLILSNQLPLRESSNSNKVTNQLQSKSTTKVKAKDKESKQAEKSTENIGIGNNSGVEGVIVGGRVVENNVMLIISKDLYFTKAQVLFLLMCVGLSYIYGKFG